MTFEQQLAETEKRQKEMRQRKRALLSAPIADPKLKTEASWTTDPDLIDRKRSKRATANRKNARPEYPAERRYPRYFETPKESWG